MRILAIETSCDETAIAIADFTRVRSSVHVHVLSHQISSQAKLHAKFGGVVPNLARREHEKNLVPLLIQALREAEFRKKSKVNPPTGGQKSKLQSKIQGVATILWREPKLLQHFKKHIMTMAPPDIDAIAVTYGPGLAPALWTGVNFARALAVLWNKPLIPTNHMAGHLFSAFLQKSGEKDPQFLLQDTEFPILALLVSGGHTELVLMRRHNKFKIIGETRDDAVGEAFDKVGRILGLAYPGGPAIARLATTGNPHAYALPRPMLHTNDYDLSFSGLKTAVLYLVRDIGKLTPQKKKDIAASFQAAAIEVLITKTLRAAQEYKIKTLALGGGVAANILLRHELQNKLHNQLPKAVCWMSEAALAGDNALMIAAAAYFSGKKFGPETDLRADVNARLG